MRRKSVQTKILLRADGSIGAVSLVAAAVGISFIRSEAEFSLVTVDINELKYTNDNFDHEAGGQNISFPPARLAASSLLVLSSESAATNLSLSPSKTTTPI